MQGFDDMTMEWDGKSYSVPADRQMDLILRVETGLLVGHDGQAYELLMRPNGPPIGQFSRVYADALRYAGAKVEPLEVFSAITSEIRNGNGLMLQTAIFDVMRILNLIGTDQEVQKAKATPGKKPAARKA